MGSHLIGGNLGYTYLGETAPGSQIYRYRVYMEFYLNCGTDSSFPSLNALLTSPNGGGQPHVGVYAQDPLAPDANKSLLTMIPMDLIDSTVVRPDTPDECTSADGLCVVKGYFTGLVDLPLSFTGYHLFFQICCRNTGILNLTDPDGTGIGYYAFIPPTLVRNSSPTFLGIPVPFICQGDTSTFINSASDADGDQLIFSFEKPYSSIGSQGGVQPPPAELTWPIPEVQHAGGFSVEQPLGASGYAFINGATGLTRYAPFQQGNYVVAVEVKEFRNGQLIGRSRRDLQLQAIPCAANLTPRRTTAWPTTYEVVAGSSLCFDMTFHDPEGDTLTLTASGLIFDPAVHAPAATIDTPQTALGSVSAQFCWDTDCAQAQDQPYLFTVSASDIGCPPKSLDVVVQVRVIPPPGPATVDGPDHVCAGRTDVIYSTDELPNSDLVWTVSGGTITGGQGSAAITVDWGAAGSGSVSVTATDANGCISAPLNIPITLTDTPFAEAGADTLVCMGQGVLLGGSPTGPLGSSTLWSPAHGLDQVLSPNPAATPDTTVRYIVSVSVAGCSSSDSVLVRISSPFPDAGVDAGLCSGDTVQLSGAGSAIPEWSPATGLSATDILDPLAHPALTTQYILSMTDTMGCQASDTVTITVSAPPNVDAGADAWLCLGSSRTLDGTGDGLPHWEPAADLSDPDVFAPLASPVITTTYVLRVVNPGCSAADSVLVTVGDDPPVDAGGDHAFCGPQVVTLGGSPTSIADAAYLWTPPDALDDATAANPIASPTVTTLYTVTVTIDTCTSQAQSLVSFEGAFDPTVTVERRIDCAGIVAHFFADAPGAVHYAWDFGDGSTGDGQDTEHRFIGPGLVTFTLTVDDGQGCSGSVTLTFDPGDGLSLEDIGLPNIFTPNSDGHNDTFGPMRNGPIGACAELIIVNRWGQKVFQSIGNALDWDGHDAAGQACVAGTYFYTFTVADIARHGALQLIR